MRKTKDMPIAGQYRLTCAFIGISSMMMRQTLRNRTGERLGGLLGLYRGPK